jgi:hypothetical protein
VEAQSEKEKITNNPGFLKAVICFMAEEKFQVDIVDPGIQDIIGPGQEFESKDQWLEETIKFWFEQTSNKIKVFKIKGEKVDLKISMAQIVFAKKYYECSVGSYITLDNQEEMHRIPGGWILRDVHDVTCFVSFSDEFKELSEMDVNSFLKEENDKTA